MKLSGSIMKKDFSVNLPLGERRIAIPMDATLKAYIDMSTFSEKNIQKDGKKLIVTLPDPKIVLTSTKIDHKGVKEYVALTRRNFTDAELTSYEAQGRKQILKCHSTNGYHPTGTGKCCTSARSDLHNDGI